MFTFFEGKTQTAASTLPPTSEHGKETLRGTEDDTPRARFEAYLRWTLIEEREVLAAVLSERDYASFLDYYAGLPSKHDEAGIRRYINGLWNGEAGWMARWIAAQSATDPSRSPVRVLDAGCGFGSFSFLFACMGAEVLGADLREDRLRVATLRRDAYERFWGRTLRVRFERRDLTRGTPETFDGVWLYNAISHIDPVARFIEVLHDGLAPGGIVVVGDINGANSQHVRRLARRRTDVHITYVDDEGESHAYADEQTFSPKQLRAVLKVGGFQILRHELVYGGTGFVPAAVAMPLHAVQAHIGPAARWARRQFLVARKPCAPSNGVDWDAVGSTVNDIGRWSE